MEAALAEDGAASCTQHYDLHSWGRQWNRTHGPWNEQSAGDLGRLSASHDAPSWSWGHLFWTESREGLRWCCFYVSAALHSYISVDLLSPHLASPYGCLSEIMKKDKMVPQLLLPLITFQWNTRVSSPQWLNILHITGHWRQSLHSAGRWHIYHLPGRGRRGRRGRTKKREFNFLLKPSESCWTVCLLSALFLSEPADPLGAGKTHSDLY